jgi:hypothetical protein
MDRFSAIGTYYEHVIHPYVHRVTYHIKWITFEYYHAREAYWHCVLESLCRRGTEEIATIFQILMGFF